LSVLKGIRILDLSRFQACPICGMILGDLGAEVIRVEEPEGAPDRTWGQCGPDGETLLYKVVGRNKKCITLSLGAPEGRKLFYELVKLSDVVLHNYTQGSPQADYLTYEKLRGVKESIIVVALSGYGQYGPDAQKPCFDGVAQARGGSMVLNGFSDEPPIKTGIPYIDVSAGLFATIAVLAALYHRDKKGEGQAIDVSLFDTATFITQSVGTLLLYELSGEVRKNIGNRGFHSYNTCQKAKDGWVVLSVATNSIWRRFAKLIGRPDMAEDPRLSDDTKRFHNAYLIDEVVSSWVAARTVEEVTSACEKARVPCGPLQTVDKLLTDVQVLAREMVVPIDYPQIGRVHVPGIPFKLSRTPGKIRTPSPALGEHNEEVYGGLLHLSGEEILQLKAKKII